MAADPITCAGYPQSRLYFESQDWWIPRNRFGETDDFQHGLLSACLPYPESSVSGMLNIDIRLQLHDNPSVVRSVKIHVNRTNNVGTGGSGLSFRTPEQEDCCSSLIVPMQLDTTKFPDGRQLVRMVTDFEDAEGLKGRASLKFVLRFANGKTVSNSTWAVNKIDVNGWYTKTGYAKCDILSKWPDGPVSGMWRPTVETGAFKDPITSDISPIVESVFALDPDFHAHPGNPGTLIKRVAGTYKGVLDIDTTKLTNGTHTLMLRAQQKDITEGRHAGVLIVPFQVSN